MKTFKYLASLLFTLLVLPAYPGCPSTQLPRLPDGIIGLSGNIGTISHTFLLRSLWSHENFGEVRRHGGKAGLMEQAKEFMGIWRIFSPSNHNFPGYTWFDSEGSEIATTTKKVEVTKDGEVSTQGEGQGTKVFRVTIFDCEQNVLGTITESITDTPEHDWQEVTISIKDGSEQEIFPIVDTLGIAFTYDDNESEDIEVFEERFLGRESKTIAIGTVPNQTSRHRSMNNALLVMLAIILERYGVYDEYADNTYWFMRIRSN